VHGHADWITQQLKKIHAQKPDQNTVLLFGTPYTKLCQYNSTEPLGIYVKGDQLICNVPEAANDASWKSEYDKKLESFLKKTARVYITTRTKQSADTMHIQYGTITLRKQDTRWGSCSSTGNLNFNWRLVHAPVAYIDYVIIHELAHRVHMNHSSSFWQLVEKYDPEYRIHKLWFKQHGGGLY
jgi:predicted metal-dependent hydrolase